MEDTHIKVLFIDDETDFIDVLIKRLEKRRISGQGADCGEAGIALLENIQVDIVVLDVCMPGMDGIHTLQTIKNKWPFIEVLMLTGHACMNTAKQGMDAGAFDYLIKPIDIDELIFKLEDAYDKIQIFKNQ
ncbi:MAG: response regulator [Desulfobacteraceae bacterium]|nr:response regulator [Desulfobacteraceae bacterium]